MVPQKTIHIKQEETDCASDERGLMSDRTLAMVLQQATYIKQEETDCAPDEPGLTSYGTQAMDHQQAMYIKEEVTDCAPDEPTLMFPEDPLKPEVPGLPIKRDPELKLHVATSENNSYGTLVMDHQQTTYIKEEESDCAPDESGLMFPEDPLKPEVPGLPIKRDPELKLHVATSENNSYGTLVMDHQQTTYIKEEESDCAPDESGLMFPEDPLKPEVSGLPIKPDPELKLHVATSENNVVASRSYADNNTRLLQSKEKCELGCEGEEEKEDEECFSAPRLKCSLEENSCQTFICSFCLQSFSSKYRLIMHVFVHIDGVDPPKSVCKLCGKVFPSYVSLKKHLKITEAEHDSSADKEETFDCSGKYYTHLGTLKGYALKETESRTHKCDICGKSFTQLSTFKSHALRHTGRKPHKCDICGKSFAKSSHIKTHALIHTGIKPHKCDICGKSFTQLGSLQCHVLIHSGTKPHKCDICGKSFTQLSHMKRHTLIHTGTKPHKCDICGKSFTELGSLKRHSLIHTRPKAFKCDIVGKSFTQRHTGRKLHKCDICGKSFSQSSHIKTHKLIHTGIKPHKCHICGKSFTQLSNLKVHALIHTGTKPYQCDICGKSFSQLSHLKGHALVHWN